MCTLECGKGDESGGLPTVFSASTQKTVEPENTSAPSNAEAFHNDLVFWPKEPAESGSGLQSLYPRRSLTSPSAGRREATFGEASPSGLQSMSSSPPKHLAQPSVLKSASPAACPQWQKESSQGPWIKARCSVEPFRISDDALSLVTRKELQDIHMQIAQALEAITERVDLKVGSAMEAITRVKETHEQRFSTVEGCCLDLQRAPGLLDRGTEPLPDKVLGAAINAIAEAVETRCQQLSTEIELIRQQDKKLGSDVEQMRTEQARFFEALEKQANITDMTHGCFPIDIGDLRQKCSETGGNSSGGSPRGNVHVTGSVILHAVPSPISEEASAVDGVDPRLTSFIERQTSASQAARASSASRIERQTSGAGNSTPIYSSGLIERQPSADCGPRNSSPGRCNMAAGPRTASTTPGPRPRIIVTGGSALVPVGIGSSLHVPAGPAGPVRVVAARCAGSPQSCSRSVARSGSVVLPNNRGICFTPSRPLPVRVAVRQAAGGKDVGSGVRASSPSLSASTSASTSVTARCNECA